MATLHELEAYAQEVWRGLASLFDSVLHGYTLFVARHSTMPSRQEQICEVGLLLLQTVCDSGYKFLQRYVKEKLQSLGEALCQHFVKRAARAITRLVVVAALQSVVRRLVISLVCLVLRQLEKFIAGFVLDSFGLGEIPQLSSLAKRLVGKGLEYVNSKLARLASGVLMPVVMPRLASLAVAVWDKDVFPAIWKRVGPSATALTLTAFQNTLGTNPVEFVTLYVSHVASALKQGFSATKPSKAIKNSFEGLLARLGCDLGFGLEKYMPGFDRILDVMNRAASPHLQPQALASTLLVEQSGSFESGSCSEHDGGVPGALCKQRTIVTIDGRQHTTTEEFVWTVDKWVPLHSPFESVLANLHLPSNLWDPLSKLLVQTLVIALLAFVVRKIAGISIAVVHRTWWKKWARKRARRVGGQSVPLLNNSPPPLSYKWKCAGVGFGSLLYLALLCALQLLTRSSYDYFDVVPLVA
eukprot:TRINITY_DN11731_c0_g1_i1.p1 TRINITY_DN11731_c0_g1~~TRINITY_DN11731_c0_g1_i1.p1  ORF type:complete len:540 (+),score=58.30 TRINITY_DN11731_c0_g1_i1:216-1622(+)